MTSEELLKDGRSMLNKAVVKGDLEGAGAAQMIITTATSKIEKLSRKVDKVKVRNRCKRRKENLLTTILRVKVINS